jgi:hypothetical protein
MSEAIENTQAVIEALCSEVRAQEILRVIQEIGPEIYFSAPASSKEDYHSCYPGGLAEHNLNVLKCLTTLNDSFKLGFSDESVCVVALLHDIGKTVNTDLKPYYVVAEERWKQERGEKYNADHGSVYFPTHQRSVWLLSKFGFALSAEEYQAILLNDGQYVQENKAYAMKECELASALHMADMLALIEEKRARSEA